MKVKALSPFNGPGGTFVKVGEVIDVDKSVARELKARRMAEILDSEPAPKGAKKS